MKVYIRLVYVILVPLLLSNQTFAAKITKKNGEVIEGKIQGLVVQKEMNIKSSADETIKSLPHQAGYLITEGSSINVIDENGIDGVGNAVFLVASKETPIDDIAVIKFGKDWLQKLAIGQQTLPDGTELSYTALSLEQIEEWKKEKPEHLMSHAKRFPLLGTFRKEKNEYKIMPSLEIKTKTGSITIPINEIIDFSSPSPQTP